MRLQTITGENIRAMRGAFFVLAVTDEEGSRLELFDLMNLHREDGPSSVVACEVASMMGLPSTVLVQACAQINGNNPMWQTMSDLLEVGDRLELYWMADIESSTMRSHGIGVDELHIRVHRTATMARQPMTFAMSYRCFARGDDPQHRLVLTGGTPNGGKRKAA